MGQWLDQKISAIGEMDAYPVASARQTFRAKLDANENWHIPQEAISGIVRAAATAADVRAYPLGVVRELSAAISTRLGVPEESIIPTEGADQGIDLICQAFAGRGEKATIVSPTYSFYRLRSTFAGGSCVQVNLDDDFSLPIDKILRKAGASGVIFLCSPNNPTGNQFQRREVLRLCDEFPGLLMVDEAYVDFAPYSVVEETQHRRNLVVLRTFSKAFGLADLRLGAIVANPDWASSFLNRVQYPYPISGLAAAIAISLLGNFELVQKGVESMKQERSWLSQQLRQIDGVNVFDSEANFLLIDLPIDYNQVHEELLKRGIVTKRVGRVLTLTNCIRVTVGTREMNSAFLDVLRDIIDVT